MSKIYEALLRAELERARQNGHSVDLPAQAPVEPLQDTLPRTRTHEDLAEKVLAPAHPLTPLDLGSISRRRWEPDFSQLPALEKAGRAVEQFRSLRSHLVEFRDLHTLKSVLIASGLPGEGKSFIAANLALSLARYKANRVALIDGDMRRSSLHVLLGAPRSPGLSDYLSGNATLLEVLQRPDPVTRSGPIRSGIGSLGFIAAGVNSDKASDLSGNGRFHELIDELGELFDWIIIDSPPIAVVSDGVNFARSCDGVLLVAREGVTKFSAAQHAQTQFKNSHVIGFVLNAMRKLPLKNDYYKPYTRSNHEDEDAA